MNSEDINRLVGRALAERPKRLPVRATFDSTTPEIFADNKQIDKLDNNNWQIIFGRRGAGKTTVLANYAKILTASPPELGLASIELNANDFIALVDRKANKLSDESIAQIYFADFMAKIASHLLAVFVNRNENSKFYRLFVREGRRRAVEDVVIQIHESVVKPEGIPFGAHFEETEHEESGSRRSHTSAGKIDVEFSASAEKLKAAAQLGAKIGGSSSNEEMVKLARKTRTVYAKYNYFRTRDLLVELLELLGLQKLVIIIDEWSELDRSTSTDIQPYFSELLKAVFWNQKRFVIKIGAVRNQTRLLATSLKGGVIGLELTGDIFCIDLDEVYTNEEIDASSFFRELIFRHLLFCEPELRMFLRGRDTTGAPIDTFTDYIFRSKAEFEQLIRGSGGLPRDFIEIFDSIAQRRENSVSERWSGADVRSAVTKHSVQKKAKNISTDPLSIQTFGRIVQMVQNNESRLLLVPQRANARLRFAIGDMYHKRLIHDVRSESIPATLRHRYDFYNVDLGIVYDALKKKGMDRLAETDDCPLDGSETPEKLAPFIVSLSRNSDLSK